MHKIHQPIDILLSPPPSRPSSTSRTARPKHRPLPPDIVPLRRQSPVSRPRSRVPSPRPSSNDTPPSSPSPRRSRQPLPRPHISPPRTRSPSPTLSESSSSSVEQPPTPRRRLHEYPHIYVGPPPSVRRTPSFGLNLGLGFSDTQHDSENTQNGSLDHLDFDTLCLSSDRSLQRQARRRRKLAVAAARERRSGFEASYSYKESAIDNLRSMSSGSSSGSALQRKILIMGSRSVGKSSLTKTFVEPGKFAESYYPTIEEVHRKQITYEGILYDCEIIDTAGQDEYSLFNHKYAVGIHGFILVYSIASRQSFEMISNLHEKIVDSQGKNSICCVVVGQKCDLGGARQVKTEEGKKLADSLNASFCETSAKEGKGINDVFDLLLADMRKVYNPPEEKKKATWFGGWFGAPAK